MSRDRKRRIKHDDPALQEARQAVEQETSERRARTKRNYRQIRQFAGAGFACPGCGWIMVVRADALIDGRCMVRGNVALCYNCDAALVAEDPMTVRLMTLAEELALNARDRDVCDKIRRGWLKERGPVSAERPLNAPQLGFRAWRPPRVPREGEEE